MNGRDAHIAAVAGALQAELTPFGVEVVRTRPAAGDYVMIVFGGTSRSILGGTANFGSYGPLDCGNLETDDITLVFDNTNDLGVANSAMFTIGISVGLNVTTRAGDCLSQVPPATACTLSASAPVDPNGACPGAGATQDEPAALMAAFACQ
jgi:hypothetical protein